MKILKFTQSDNRKAMSTVGGILNLSCEDMTELMSSYSGIIFDVETGRILIKYTSHYESDDFIDFRFLKECIDDKIIIPTMYVLHRETVYFMNNKLILSITQNNNIFIERNSFTEFDLFTYKLDKIVDTL